MIVRSNLLMNKVRSVAELMTIEEMREHEWSVSWSGGKDSTATILLMREHGIPIKQITYVRMMWDDELPRTLPLMTEFVDQTAEVFRSWGYKVVMIPSAKTAVQLRDSVYKFSRRPELNGHKYGVIAFLRGYCRFSGIKTRTIKKYSEKDAWEMIGYRADEEDRIHRLGGKKQSIMVALGIRESDAFEICRKAGMLSPLYFAKISRDGCWFCPNCSKKWRELLRREHPELVQKITDMIEETLDIMKAGAISRNNWVIDYFKQKDQEAQMSLFDERTEI